VAPLVFADNLYAYETVDGHCARPACRCGAGRPDPGQLAAQLLGAHRDGRAR
jgi:hypothetical protein